MVGWVGAGHWAIYNYIIRGRNNLSSEQVTRLLSSRGDDQTGQQDNYNLRRRQTHYRSYCVTISFLFLKLYENTPRDSSAASGQAPRETLQRSNYSRTE